MCSINGLFESNICFSKLAIHRLVSFPLSKNNFNKELSTIKEIARNNGYNENLIDSILKKKQRKLLKKEFYSIKPPKNNNYKLINYSSRISNNVCNKINKLGYNNINK